MMPDASVSMTRRRGTAMQALSRAFPFPVTLLNKARWGKDGVSFPPEERFSANTPQSA